jgi:hypothetical protein
MVDRTRVSVRDALCEMFVKIVGKIHNKGKEELESIHREKRATTESMIELLERILAGATSQEDDAALGNCVAGNRAQTTFMFYSMPTLSKRTIYCK